MKPRANKGVPSNIRILGQAKIKDPVGRKRILDEMEMYVEITLLSLVVVIISSEFHVNILNLVL